jgi:hypothetical protein
MRVDLAARLHRAMNGDFTQKSVVTPVTPVTGVTGYRSNPLRLHGLHGLQVKNNMRGNGEKEPVTEAVTTSSEPGEVEIEERKAMAMGSVPEPFLDAWARLQLQWPYAMPEAHWQQAIDDAGRFLDQWGSVAFTLDWTPGDLFDVPANGKPGGLVWSLQGETVRGLGPEQAVTQSGRVFDRLENNQETRR